MHLINQWLSDLSSGVVANIIAAGLSTLLLGTLAALGIKGKKPNKTGTGIRLNRNTGQFIHAPDNSGSINASYTDNSQHTTTNINNTVKDYGKQENPNPKETPGKILLCWFATLIAIGALVSATGFIYLIQPLPLVLGIITLAISAILLIKRRSHYTTIARSKAIATWAVLLSTTTTTNKYLINTQDTGNPYSLYSIANASNTAVETGAGWGRAIFDRGNFLLAEENRTLLFAWVIDMLTLVSLLFIFTYFLRLILGSLLFPASSNGKKFGKFFSSLNNSFVQIGWPGLVTMWVMTLLLPWVASESGITQLIEWGSSAQQWLQNLIAAA